jgi:hypothetical protein
MYLTQNIVARSRDQCCCGKAGSITYSECVSVALIIQLAKRMHLIILPSVACPAVPFFPTLSLNKKEKIFREIHIVHSPTNSLFIKLGKV